MGGKFSVIGSALNRDKNSKSQLPKSVWIKRAKTPRREKSESRGAL